VKKRRVEEISEDDWDYYFYLGTTILGWKTSALQIEELYIALIAIETLLRLVLLRLIVTLVPLISTMATYLYA